MTHPENLPIPTGYRVLVKPLEPKEQTTDAGIVIPGAAQEADSYMQPVAEVIALGPAAYKDTKQFPEGPWCQPGDYVLINYHEGQKVELREAPDSKKFVRYKIINDQDVRARIPDPSAVRTYTN